jgi:hypothetical protein
VLVVGFCRSRGRQLAVAPSTSCKGTSWSLSSLPSSSLLLLLLPLLLLLLEASLPPLRGRVMHARSYSSSSSPCSLHGTCACISVMQDTTGLGCKKQSAIAQAITQGVQSAPYRHRAQ